MDEKKENSRKKKLKGGLFDARFESNNNYFTISIYVILTFTICLIIYKFINNWREAGHMAASIMSTFSSFLIAFLIAYFINPTVGVINKLIFDRLMPGKHEKLHKVLSLILAYCVLIGFIAATLTIILPQLIESLMTLVRQLTNFYDTLNGWLLILEERFPSIDFEYIRELSDQYLPNTLETIQQIMSSFIPRLYNAGISIISWFVNLILAFVISCYIMIDKGHIKLIIKRLLYAFFDEPVAARLLQLFKSSNKIFSNFIIGKTVDSLIIGVICAIAMTILRLPYALLISLIVGITNMIPYFGPFIGAVPGLIILLITSPVNALIFLILILALQQFDGAILGPRILGNSTGLSPIWIIFAITVGGALGGVLGMFLGVPIVAVLVNIFNNILDYLLYLREIKPDVSNVSTPNLHPENIFLPADFLEDEEGVTQTVPTETDASVMETPAMETPETETPEIDPSKADASATGQVTTDKTPDNTNK